MKKSTILLFLSLLLIAGNLPRCYATPPYRPGGSRDIDADYCLKADGGGGISLCQRPADDVIFKVQGSGNSEYCAKRNHVFLRIVPFAESENENEEENGQKPQRRELGPPERISLPGQPYEYYIFEKDTAHMIGPLTEKEFASHDLVSGGKIKWRFVETSGKEYSDGMRNMVIAILFMSFCIYVLPFLILLVAIIYIIRRAFRERRQAKESH